MKFKLVLIFFCFSLAEVCFAVDSGEGIYGTVLFQPNSENFLDEVQANKTLAAIAAKLSAQTLAPGQILVTGYTAAGGNDSPALALTRAQKVIYLLTKDKVDRRLIQDAQSGVAPNGPQGDRAVTIAVVPMPVVSLSAPKQSKIERAAQSEPTIASLPISKTKQSIPLPFIIAVIVTVLIILVVIYLIKM
jgi:hypothetical protein